MGPNAKPSRTHGHRRPVLVRRATSQDNQTEESALDDPDAEPEREHVSKSCLHFRQSRERTPGYQAPSRETLSPVT